MAQQKWTKRCDAGEDCVGASQLGGDQLLAYLVPDDHTLCDRCLLVRYLGDRDAWGTYDSCDSEGRGPELYEEEKVIAALRRAEKGESFESS